MRKAQIYMKKHLKVGREGCRPSTERGDEFTPLKGEGVQISLAVVAFYSIDSSSNILYLFKQL